MPRAASPRAAVPAQVGSRRVDPRDDLIEWITWLMDGVVRIPGTKISVGLDALIGLIPGAGDVLTGAVQAGLVLIALRRYNVPKAVAARMAANVLLDIGVGAIPLVGDLFDVAFKANTRNLKLIREVRDLQVQGQAVPSAPSKRYLLTVGALLGGALVLVLAGFVAVLVWVFQSRPLW